MHKTISLTNVALRGALETGIVAALAVWGAALVDGPLRIALALLAPAIVFGFWGAVDFRFARRRAEALRLAQELAVTLLAAAALARVGHPVLAWALVAVSVVHHAAVYALGERLLRPRAARP